MKSSFRLLRERLIGSLLILFLVFPSPLLANMPPQEKEQLLLNALQNEVNRLTPFFTTEGTLDKADYEADALIEFVAKDIAFQPYAGVLKGVDGTLRTRAGNSHDQALLLAKLLNDAGYETAMLGTTLNDNQAAELVQKSVAVADAPLWQTPPELAELLEQFRKDSVTRSKLVDQADAVATKLLEKASTDIGKNQNILQLAEQATKEYRWVRYRLAASDEWQQAHPAWKGAADWKLEPTKITLDQVESADLQTLEIEAFIDTQENERVSVTGLWQAPLANIQNQPLYLSIASNAMASGTSVALSLIHI